MVVDLPTLIHASRARLGSYALVLGAPKYSLPKHLEHLAEKLEAVDRGEITRLIIETPPRHGKTMMASEYFPAWFLGRNPDRYVISTTYSGDKAKDNGRKVRNLIADPIHREVFPGCEMSGSSKAADHFSTTKEGEYFSVGVYGPITGRGAHLFLIDDPIKGRVEASSVVQRNKLQEWYTSVAHTRLMPGGAIILIMTRWDEMDLAGWVTAETGERWERVHLPALAGVDDQLGRAPGEALWPEQFPREWLLAKKKTIGGRDWESLYQQAPQTRLGAAYLHEIWDEGRHIVPKFIPPATWPRWRAMDWGFKRPFSVGWYTQDFDGVIYRYRELYGWGGEPNIGTEEDAETIARQIVQIEEMETNEGLEFRNNPADASIWSKHGHERTIEDHFGGQRVVFTPMDQGPGSRVRGAQEIAWRLRNDLFKVTSNCTHFIRTVPLMQPDAKNPEDIDTNQEDHAWDEVKGSLMSRRRPPVKEGNKNGKAKPFTWGWLTTLEEKERSPYRP